MAANGANGANGMGVDMMAAAAVALPAIVAAAAAAQAKKDLRAIETEHLLNFFRTRAKANALSVQEIEALKKSFRDRPEETNKGQKGGVNFGLTRVSLVTDHRINKLFKDWEFDSRNSRDPVTGAEDVAKTKQDRKARKKAATDKRTEVEAAAADAAAKKEQAGDDLVTSCNAFTSDAFWKRLFYFLTAADDDGATDCVEGKKAFDDATKMLNELANHASSHAGCLSTGIDLQKQMVAHCVKFCDDEDTCPWAITT